MGILPSFLNEQIKAAVSEAEQEEDEPLKEYEINFETGQLTGRIVEGKEALKVWIWNCLKTQKDRYEIYTSSYGMDMDQYFGQTLDEYTQSEIMDDIETALKENRYITGISDFEVLGNDAGKQRIRFTAETTLGDLEVDTYV